VISSSNAREGNSEILKKKSTGAVETRQEFVGMEGPRRADHSEQNSMGRTRGSKAVGKLPLGDLQAASG